MKRQFRSRLLSLILAVTMLLPLLSDCGGTRVEKEDANTITVYMWSNALYESYAPYVQSQLPDLDIQFVLGNNDLDFYKFMDENGALPVCADAHGFIVNRALFETYHIPLPTDYESFVSA